MLKIHTKSKHLFIGHCRGTWWWLGVRRTWWRLRLGCALTSVENFFPLAVDLLFTVLKKNENHLRVKSKSRRARALATRQHVRLMHFCARLLSLLQRRAPNPQSPSQINLPKPVVNRTLNGRSLKRDIFFSENGFSSISPLVRRVSTSFLHEFKAARWRTPSTRMRRCASSST